MGGSNDETASTIADFLIKTILRHGAGRIQVTDIGTEFKNSTMRQVTEAYGINHIFTTPYHQQANGLDERTNQTLQQGMRKLLDQDNPNDWHKYIDHVVSAISMTKQSSIGYAPIYLREPRTPRMGFQNQLEYCSEVNFMDLHQTRIDQSINLQKQNNS